MPPDISAAYPVTLLLVMIKVVHTTSDLRVHVNAWRKQNETIALTPTMGYLHKAHLALIEAGRQRCSKSIVSIFVNPKQFGPDEDFERYPRDEENDLRILTENEVDLAFVPRLDEMYPADFSTSISVSRLTQNLCAISRPGHFNGVATICAKLFNQCLPDVAVFGEKDYQQLQVIRHMVKDLNIPIEICSVRTVRESDGLAISSRNVYLDQEGRTRAARINEILSETAARLYAGHQPPKELANATAQLIEKVGAPPEYIELCDEDTLVPVVELKAPARLMLAITVNRTRLIDNWPVLPPQ